MEQTQEIFINMDTFCVGNHQCQQVCIEQKCLAKSIFICQEPICETSSIHQQCYKCQIKPTLSRIQKKHTFQYKKHHTSLKAIQAIYDNILQELSKCREQFLQYVSTFGINQKTVQLIKCLNYGQFQKSSRQMWFKAYQQSKKFEKTGIYSGLESIKLLKQSIYGKLNEIKRQLKSFQYKPQQQGLNAKTLQECSQFTQLEAEIRIRKFFESPIDQFKLVFRASDHEFSSKQFHSKCDWIANTILIVKNDEGKVLGGYTSLDWSQVFNSKFKADQSGQSFLFSINLNQKFHLVQKQKALYCNSNYGPTFGSGFDLFISNNCHKNSTSFANFTKSYINQKFSESQKTNAAITGKAKRNEFKVVQYQIFKIIWK